ncbi:MAG TPA: hypothetical protein VKV02_02940, partial [Acidobacteriaceae bacterium]|nr:hypothetical protein [Acidobacteriaceae bacterium]
GKVVLERTVELHVPVAKNVLVSSPKFPAQMTTEGGEKVFRWKGSQLEPTPKPRGAGEDAGTEPEARDEDRTPPIAWTTFANWEEVGAWYRSIAETSEAPTPELKARADAIVYGKKTPEAKIEALYEFVSSEVRSLQIPFGVGNYRPHTATEVLTNLYGDAKDKSALLAALLKAENLPVSTVLIGAGTEVDAAVPAPGWFNDVITLTHDAPQGDVWLDTLPEIAPYGVLDRALRDRLALVIPPTGQATLRRTPAELPFAAFTRFTSAGTLTADGALTAHVDQTLRGDQEMAYRQALRTAGQTQWDRVSQFYVNAGGLSGTVSNTVADLPERTEAPLHLTYEYSQAPYGDWSNFRVTALEPGLELPFATRKTPPGRDIDLGGKRTDTAVSRLTLPPGFGADLPPATHLKTEFATLDKTYRLEQSGSTTVLVTERTLGITAGKVPAAQWPAYRKFLDDAGDTEPWVQLTSLTAEGGAGRRPPAAGMDNPAAAQLVAKADRAIETKDPAEAAKRLDEAKALNPRQALLWSSYGVIAQRTGKRDEAIEDFKKELKEHPEEAFVSQMLAVALADEGKTADGVAALRAAAALNPHDARTAVLLASLLEKTDPSGAEKALRAGLTGSPESLELKLALGTLLVREGKLDEGGVLLTAVATSSQDPQQVNDAAYALGEASLNLRLAESAARRAVQMLNALTARPAQGVASGTALRRVEQLVSCWDTYGWILYRTGSYSEAEPWLRAAWADSYGAEPGKHLAALLQKEGQGAEAARILHLAAQADPGTEDEPGDGDAVPTGRKVPQPQGSREKTSGADKVSALEVDHTFPVAGPGGATKGIALFEFDYSLNAPVQVRMVSGDDDLSGLTDALRKVETHTLLPPGSPAHLLRRGVVTCRGGGPCTLRMLSTRQALVQ